MALGGGTFTNQNKVLPGSYINFVSLAKASAAVSDRGIACIAESGSLCQRDILKTSAYQYEWNGKSDLEP